MKDFSSDDFAAALAKAKRVLKRINLQALPSVVIDKM